MKKLLTILAVVILALSLAACGGGSGGGTEPAKDQPKEEPAKTNQQGKSNIVGMGTPATGTFTSNTGVTDKVTMQVDEVVRGEAALKMINESSVSGFWEALPPKDETHEYLVAKITVTLVERSEDSEFKVALLNPWSKDSEQYPTLIVATFYNDDTFPDIKKPAIAPGETVTGYQIFEVAIDDDAPMLSYRARLADFSDGLWFKLS
jgi:hypothetical protein